MLAVILAVFVTYQQAPQIPQTKPQKYLVVDLEDQKIYRFEGERLIDSSNISTGRRWHNLKAKRQRYRTSYTIVAKQGAAARSTIPGKYNLKTPYKFVLSPTVAKHGERMHGFAKVPRHPASHGCIRLPIGYAKAIYPWVESGKTKVFVTLQYGPHQTAATRGV